MIQKLVERIIVFRLIQVYFVNASIQRRSLPLYSLVADLYTEQNAFAGILHLCVSANNKKYKIRMHTVYRQTALCCS